MKETMVAAIVDRAEGNAEIGTSWQDVAIFSPETTVKEIIAWAQRNTSSHDGVVRGKIQIRYAEDRMDN